MTPDNVLHIFDSPNLVPNYRAGMVPDAFLTKLPRNQIRSNVFFLVTRNDAGSINSYLLQVPRYRSLFGVNTFSVFFDNSRWYIDSYKP